jgi:hypothetical protein
MVYLIVTLPLYAKLEFINIIRISTNNVHMFRAPISRANIIYSIVEYIENKFKRGDIIAVYKLVK